MNEKNTSIKLFSPKKERSTDITLYDLWKHYAKLKKPDTIDHILNEHTYMKNLEQANS